MAQIAQAPRTAIANWRGPQAQIRAQIGSVDQEGVLTVTDSGLGVAPEIEGCLFEPFFTMKDGCMRLGLLVSLSLAQAQGGRLWHEPVRHGRPHGFSSALPFARLPDD